MKNFWSGARGAQAELHRSAQVVLMHQLSALALRGAVAKMVVEIHEPALILW